MTQKLRDLYPELTKSLETRKNEILHQFSLDRSNLHEQNPSLPGDVADLSVADTNADYVTHLANHHSEELTEVKNALERIQQGTYGVCEDCEESIGIARLNKLPHARFCIKCQKKAEKSNSHLKS